MKVIIAAGGSGGHIFPAIALAKKLKEKRPDIDILFIGSDKELDKRIFKKEGLKFSLLSANKLPYKTTLALVPFSIKLFLDTVKAFFVTASFKPDAVIGFGGYVTAPVILAAFVLRIPRVLHEQNVVPGRANKALFRLANKVALTFEESLKFLGAYQAKAAITGNPIRASIFKDNRLESMKSFGFEPNRFTILVIGGSQGAHFLNESFVNALSGLDAKARCALQVIHITGIKDYEWAKSEYIKMGLAGKVFSFIDDIHEAYSASDLVVTRSGASAIFEAALFGKAMILVPYPFASAHQGENAKAFSRKGAAIEVAENNLTAESFKYSIMSLLSDRKRLIKLGEAAKKLSVPDSANRLAEQILSLAKV